MSNRRLFSDIWHRVATIKVGLRPTIHSHRQHFRGEPWYLLQDPFNNRFFRLRPEAWEFVARLTPTRTVEDVWLAELERNPHDVPGQEDVVELLSQLNRLNLLYFDNAADAEKLFQRYSQRRRKEIRAKLLSFIAIRIPLIDPDDFLKRWSPYIKPFLGVPGLLLWLAVMFSTIIPLSERGGVFVDQASGVLAPDNLVWLYVAMALVKVFHEYGHGFFCRYYGGEVHVMGLMFIVFIPLPYVDATASWSLRSRYQRALVSSAGMIVELFIAALATWVWAYTSPGVINSIAYNMIFVASVSTILFNGNPLLRFDGYYILSDLIDVPNLYSRSRQQLTYLFERYLAGCRHLISPAHHFKEAVWLVNYGLLSIFYRLVIFVGITIYVADNYLLLGVVMAIVLVVMTVIVPPLKLIRYLATSAKLVGHRNQAILVALIVIGSLVTLVTVVPFKDYFRANGVIESVNYQQVILQSSGYLVSQLNAESGRWVEKDDVLMIIENPLIAIELKKAEGYLQEAEVRLQQARFASWNDIEPLQLRIEDAHERVNELRQRQLDLQVKAPISGKWLADEENLAVGRWFNRGTEIGRVLNDQAYQLIAVVRQDDASRLFDEPDMKMEVRLYGQADQILNVSELNIIPYQHQHLPSAALGWLGGGEIQVDMRDEQGRFSQEPFYLMKAPLVHIANMPFWHGQTGKIRVQTKNSSLMEQLMRSLQQLLQRRFQL